MGEKPVFQSFAEAMAAFATLTKLESAIESAIKDSLVPHHETRKMLRAMSALEAQATPLAQYMEMLFEKIGLGRLRLSKKEIFRIEFSVENSPIARIYRRAKGKTCYITAETLTKFFTIDLQIPSACKEIECENEGAKACKFLVEMQPLAVYQIALDSADNEIIEALFHSNETIQSLAEKTGYSEEEVKFRCEILEKFHLIEGLRLTDIGIAYRKSKTKVASQEQVFPPPWENFAKISENIAQAESFAEAIARTVEQEEEVVVDEKDVINLAEEAKKSKSFAELLFKKLKEERKEEDKNGGK